MKEHPATRVYFIDWLRILAVLLLFPIHTLRVFGMRPRPRPALEAEAVTVPDRIQP